MSSLGGPDELALTPVGGDDYRFTLDLPGPVISGTRAILFRLKHRTAYDLLLMTLRHDIDIFQAGDLVLFDDSLPAGATTIARRIEAVEFASSQHPPAYEGDTSLPLHVERFSGLPWTFSLAPETAVDTLGFDVLRFAFHLGTSSWPGTLSENQFIMELFDPPGAAVPFLEQLDLDRPEWQEIEVPVRNLNGGQILESIRFRGNRQGTFFLDDVRLLARPAPITAVLENHADVQPEHLSLEQNCPNPFNSDTVIHFALPVRDQVELSIYNLAGQRVVTLLQGQRPPGLYTLRWDGRDEAGAELASGVYLYRLQAGEQIEQRKLLLLR